MAFRAASVFVLTLASLSGCDGLGARGAGAHTLLQAQPGEAWLYAYSNDAVSAQSTLLQIDPVTGAAVPIGAPIAGFIDALAFDEANRVLYGAWRATAPPASSELVTIDWHDGTVTPVGPLVTTDPGTPSDASVEGLTFADDGALLGFTHGPDRLVEIAPTGHFLHLADLDFTLDAYGAAFVDSELYAVDATAQSLRVLEVDPSTGTGVTLFQQTRAGASVGATSDDLGTFYTVVDSELYELDTHLVPLLVADTGWGGLGSLAWIAESVGSVEDECPCDADWKNHGEYVSCVAHWADAYATSGKERGAIVSSAARSDCGK